MRRTSTPCGERAVHAANGDHGRRVDGFLRDELGATFIQFIPIIERATPETPEVADAGRGGRVTGSLQGNESAVRWHRIVDEIITTTSRYMIGNIVISIICGTIHGTTSVILGLPYPLASQ